MAAGLIRLVAMFTPMHAFLQCCYFTLRCGGKTGITFIYDCAFMCFGSVPLAYCLAHFTGINILWMYAFVQAFELTKCAFGLIMVKKGVWLNNIVSDGAAPTV
jgi:Na+-driven multidrug efflux pump